jgi:cell division protein FtsB
MDLRVKQFPKIRALPRAGDGIRALVERAPQAEELAERTAEKFRPALAWFFGARRRLATAGVCIVTAWMFVHIVFGSNGMVMYRQKHAEYQALEKDLSRVQKENQQYTEQIKELKTDPAAIEREAREQLHYARPGEMVYVAPAGSAVQAPENKAAQK